MSNAEIIEAAKHAAKQAPSWIEFSNYMFHPIIGLFARAFPNERARAKFFKSPERDELTHLMAELIDRDGFDGKRALQHRTKGKAHKIAKTFVTHLRVNSGIDC